MAPNLTRVKRTLFGTLRGKAAGRGEGAGGHLRVSITTYNKQLVFIGSP